MIETAAFLQTGLISPGLERQEGLSLELSGVGRHDAGVYVCTATNGVGKPARAEITVDVKCEWLSQGGAVRRAWKECSLVAGAALGEGCPRGQFILSTDTQRNKWDTPLMQKVQLRSDVQNHNGRRGMK